MLAWLAAYATAAPTVDQLQRTALASRRDEQARASAILALSEREDGVAALERIAAEVDPESRLGRLATVGLVEHATLEALATRAWPEWARAHVEARIAEVLPAHCDAPAARTLPLDPALVARACADRLPVDLLAVDLVAGQTAEARARAAGLLQQLAPLRADAGAAVLAALRWAPHREPRFAGGGALIPAIPLADPVRRAVVQELVLWRIHLVLVGRQQIPERLTAELHALLADAIDRYGAPTDTRDWLHLHASTGGDPRRVIDRLGLTGDALWEVVVDEDHALARNPRRALPLLAHRSAVVRARAAEHLEDTPQRTVRALDRAWRNLPGRQAPLRGPVASPALARSEADADRWSFKLLRWAKRTSRQKEDRALEATLSLLADPVLADAMHPTILVEQAQRLLALARRDPGPRAALLVLGMDGLLRHVSLEDARDPAPDDAAPNDGTWVRAMPGDVQDTGATLDPIAAIDAMLLVELELE